YVHAIRGHLLFKTRNDVLLSDNYILAFQRVANFRFKLVDDLITSSSESILAYITSVSSEIGNDNAMIANVE
ncbi:4580_t:CDS:2, partial [Racocetra fulgida]